MSQKTERDVTQQIITFGVFRPFIFSLLLVLSVSSVLFFFLCYLFLLLYQRKTGEKRVGFPGVWKRETSAAQSKTKTEHLRTFTIDFIPKAELRKETRSRVTQKTLVSCERSRNFTRTKFGLRSFCCILGCSFFFSHPSQIQQVVFCLARFIKITLSLATAPSA